VGLADHVHSLSDGLATAITNASHPFSAGQALRLMVARGLLARPRLLVIDGTLDAMDHESQVLMLDVLRTDVPDLTVLLLTHELSLARSLPRAFEIRDRAIVEVQGGLL
jgi:ABC-type transport system involved in cytochrome bd biosynthesis fused ATPase/permease subunit